MFVFKVEFNFISQKNIESKFRKILRKYWNITITSYKAHAARTREYIYLNGMIIKKKIIQIAYITMLFKRYIKNTM